MVTPLHGQGRAKFIVYSQPRKVIAGRLVQAKGCIERIKQSRVAKWLEQALHRTLFEHSWAYSLISLSGDEDDWNLLPAALQFLLKFRPGHPRHGNVELAIQADVRWRSLLGETS